MSLLVWFGAGVIAFVLAMYALYREADDRPRPVLPAHYDVGNYVHDPSAIPGWCVHCETMNDPGYRFCENCAAKLPTTRTDSSSSSPLQFSS